MKTERDKFIEGMHCPFRLLIVLTEVQSWGFGKLQTLHMIVIMMEGTTDEIRGQMTDIKKTEPVSDWRSDISI